MVTHHLAKVGHAGSIPVFRLFFLPFLNKNPKNRYVLLCMYSYGSIILIYEQDNISWIFRHY